VDGKPYLEFTYYRRVSAPGINYEVETSANGVAWTPERTNYEQIGLTATQTDLTVRIRVLPAIGTPGAAARFARLRVSAP
jgi:hypothetical protein